MTAAVAQILVVDDDPAICALVKRCLGPGGYEVSAVHDGGAMQRALRREAADLVILDLNLSGEDGLDHLRRLRRDFDMPVIILTARGESIDRIVGLELGADDYVPKPFEPRELLARVRTVLRRCGVGRGAGAERAPTGEVLAFGDFRLDLGARRLLRGEAEIALTTAQFDVLAVLAGHPNRALNRDQILDLARNRATGPFDRSIDVHISQLRRRLGDDPRQPSLIKTVYGVGYQFAATVQRL